jgi:hypothetical protein
MANSDLAFTGGIGAAVSVATFLLIHVLKPFFTAANHKRVRSICCGRVCVTSLDVENTTPTVVLREMPSGVQSPRPPRAPPRDVESAAST